MLAIDSVDRLAKGDEGARKALGALLEYARWAICKLLTDQQMKKSAYLNC